MSLVDPQEFFACNCKDLNGLTLLGREMLSVAGQEQTILLQQLQKVFQKLDRSEQTIASEW